MIRPDHREPPWCLVGYVVTEGWPRPDEAATVGEEPPGGVEPDAAEADDDRDTRQRRNLGDQVRMAGRDLGRCRLVVGGSAADGGSDERIGEREAVAGVSRRGNAREAVRVHGAHQKVSRAERSIAGEDAPGPVRAVRRGRQADDEHPRLRVAEARHRPAPVDLVAVRGFLLRGDALAVGAKPCAAVAGDDLFPRCGECSRHGINTQLTRITKANWIVLCDLRELRAHRG